MNVGEDTKRILLGEDDVSAGMSDAQRDAFIKMIGEQAELDAKKVLSPQPPVEPLETEQSFREKIIEDRVELDGRFQGADTQPAKPTLPVQADRLALASLVWFLERSGNYKKIPISALDGILLAGNRRVVFERKEDCVKVSVIVPEGSEVSP